MIYADNAATTRLSATALAAMLPYLTEQYGNPSSLYTLGQTAATALAQGGVHQVGTAQGGQDVLQVLHGDLLPLGNVFQGNVIPGVVVG